MLDTKCYMCSQEAISREHIPPICIFPEAKDLPPGIDYRKSLITVPSCDDHNLQNSRDDEYLLFLLTTNYAVNSAGLTQWFTKIKRSINHSRAKLGIYRNLRPVSINGITTGIYNIDKDRIDREIDKISRGIYYHHFQQTWPYKIDVVLPAAIAIGSPENNEITRNVTSLVGKFLCNEITHGANPEIFQYQYKVKVNLRGYILRMVFYGGVEVATLSNLGKRKH